jgi:uncharacterized protein (DUF433 family)
MPLLADVLLTGQEVDMTNLDRITQQPGMMGGKPCIRGMRVTVGLVVGQIGAGRTIEEVLADYPYLEREDILQALRYAAWLAEERQIDIANA